MFLDKVEDMAEVLRKMKEKGPQAEESKDEEES
jgi:hypothetical protein